MVKIYRLITRNSYEREMFEKASLKLGLDKAILQSMSGRVDEVSQVSFHEDTLYRHTFEWGDAILQLNCALLNRL